MGALKKGDTGSAVKELQKLLGKAGARPKPEASGTYDDATVKAVQYLQKAYGMPATGVADAHFQKGLTIPDSALVSKVPAYEPVIREIDADNAKAMQTLQKVRKDATSDGEKAIKKMVDDFWAKFHAEYGKLEPALKSSNRDFEVWHRMAVDLKKLQATLSGLRDRVLIAEVVKKIDALYGSVEATEKKARAGTAALERTVNEVDSAIDKVIAGN